jgi:hypothetical protein
MSALLCVEWDKGLAVTDELGFTASPPPLPQDD